MDNTTIASLLRQMADLLETDDTKPEPEAKPKTPRAKASKAEPEPREAGPSLEEVRKRLSDLVKAGRSKDVKAALSSLGVSRLSDLDSSRYPDLLGVLADA